MRRDEVRLKHILNAAVQIGEFVRDMKWKKFADDRKTQAAVIRELEIIGEAVKHVSKELKDKHQNVRWDDFADLRNMFIHEYFRLKLRDIWKIVTEDVPKLKKQIEGTLAGS